MKGAKLNKNLSTFLRHIDSIRDTLPMTMLLIHPHGEKASKELLDFINNNVEKVEEDDCKKKILVKAEESKLFETLERNASISSLASKIIPESLFVSLISQYDAFINRLLRAIFEIKPEMLNGSDRNILFSQLVEYNSIEDAREYIIEKEIDTVLRKSHSEQFDYLENRLGMKLREKLPIWKTFIELTERRNILVHCDGVVSNQYIKNCKEHSCSIVDVSIGKRLDLTPEYFSQAYYCLYEMSVKLTHTIWRKLLISDLKNADDELNDCCYNLIINDSYHLADVLLEFGYAQKKKFNDSSENVFIINRALSKYLQGKNKEAKKILEKKDWSASSYDFKLANEVIKENYEVVYRLMRKIGKNGDVDKTAYKEWPLFSKIRNITEFTNVYKEIFEEEYSVLETPLRPVIKLINKELKKKIQEKTVKKGESEKEII